MVKILRRNKKCGIKEWNKRKGGEPIVIRRVVTMSVIRSDKDVVKLYLKYLNEPFLRRHKGEIMEFLRQYNTQGNVTALECVADIYWMGNDTVMADFYYEKVRRLCGSD